jgi:hypothetical protein
MFINGGIFAVVIESFSTAQLSSLASGLPLQKRCRHVYRNALHDRCVRRLRGIEIPRLFRLDAFAATIAEHRNRALHVLLGTFGYDFLPGITRRNPSDLAHFVAIPPGI